MKKSIDYSIDFTSLFAEIDTRTLNRKRDPFPFSVQRFGLPRFQGFPAKFVGRDAGHLLKKLTEILGGGDPDPAGDVRTVQFCELEIAGRLLESSSFEVLVEGGL